MIVQRIKASRFMSFDQVDVELPESGIVVVTGKNGQGKSALLEVVATALYGETVRGTSPWRDEAGFAHVDIAGVEGVEWARRAGGKKKGVSFSSGVDYPTPSKAAEALEALLPSYKIWRSCSVFRGPEAAVFSGATDSSRKELLERVLGLDLFDRALKACRVDLSNSRAGVQSHEARQSRLVALMERESQAIGLAKRDLEADVSGAVEHRGVEVDLGRVYDDLERAQKERVEVTATTAKTEVRLEDAKRRAALFKSGSCPTCERPLDSKLKKKVADDLDRASREAEREQAKAMGAFREFTSRISELREQARKLESKKSENEATKAIAARIERSRRQLAEFEAKLLDFGRQKTELDAELESTRREAVVLEEVEKVLGLRGVRSAVLSRALAGLEAVANGALAALSPDIRIEVRPFSERKDGSTAETISIQVEGAGGGHGYAGSSDGQRRRIDVALLIALSTVAEGAMGRIGDLWFDEVFDGLDSDGVAALGDLLAEMAADRKVVVVSHNPALLESLRSRASLRLHVEAGKVTSRAA